MPVERFEPSTLAGSVFETDAYTVPPHRLVVRLSSEPYDVCMIAYCLRKVKRLFRWLLRLVRVRDSSYGWLGDSVFADAPELLVALFK